MFDYRTATEAEILAKAQELKGRVLGSLPHAKFTAASGAAGRGEVGHAVEAYFGITPNPSPLPDFPGAGIELKVVPLRRTGKGLGVKERTVISLIDYVKLMDQTWETASVRSKLRILFVFFEHIDGADKRTFPIPAVHLWEPDERVEALLRADWNRVFTKVRQGRAHELTESDGSIMGPCTKGVSGASLRTQPFESVPAKPRAWALKPSFTTALFRSITAGPPKESLLEPMGLSNAPSFEERLVARFAPYVNRPVGAVGKELGIPPSGSKSYVALVARRLFGAKTLRGRIAEFEEMGITFRITRVDHDLMPYEAMSFPAFRCMELVNETWQDSRLLASVEYMLWLPIRGTRRETPAWECEFMSPVFWRPTTGELELIRREWEIYKLEINRGGVESLPLASETLAIHVRPHARNAADTDEAPFVGPTIKRSFWLNKGLIHRILIENSQTHSSP